MLKIRHFLLTFVILIPIFTLLGVIGAQFTDSDRILLLETSQAEMRGTIERHDIALGFVTPTPTFTPTRTPTATRTVTPSPSRTPSSTATLNEIPTVDMDPPTPTEEINPGMSATPTFFNATNTPTRTVTPVRTPQPNVTPTLDPFWYNGCAPDGTFTSTQTTPINRRTGPGTNFPIIQREGKAYQIMPGEIEFICFRSMTETEIQNGFIWVQASENTPVYFAVARVTDGVKDWWGNLAILMDE